MSDFVVLIRFGYSVLTAEVKDAVTAESAVATVVRDKFTRRDESEISEVYVVAVDDMKAIEWAALSGQVAWP